MLPVITPASLSSPYDLSREGNVKFINNNGELSEGIYTPIDEVDICAYLIKRMLENPQPLAYPTIKFFPTYYFLLDENNMVIGKIKVTSPQLMIDLNLSSTLTDEHLDETQKNRNNFINHNQEYVIEHSLTTLFNWAHQIGEHFETSIATLLTKQENEGHQNELSIQQIRNHLQATRKRDNRLRLATILIYIDPHGLSLGFSFFQDLLQLSMKFFLDNQHLKIELLVYRACQNKQLDVSLYLSKARQFISENEQLVRLNQCFRPLKDFLKKGFLNHYFIAQQLSNLETLALHLINKKEILTTKNFLSESHRLLIGLFYMSIRGSAQMKALTYLLPQFDDIDLQFIANIALGKTLFSYSKFNILETQSRNFCAKFILNRLYDLTLIYKLSPTYQHFSAMTYSILASLKTPQPCLPQEIELLNFTELREMLTEKEMNLIDSYHPMTVELLWSFPVFQKLIKQQYPQKKYFVFCDNLTSPFVAKINFYDIDKSSQYNFKPIPHNTLVANTNELARTWEDIKKKVISTIELFSQEATNEEQIVTDIDTSNRFFISKRVSTDAEVAKVCVLI